MSDGIEGVPLDSKKCITESLMPLDTNPIRNGVEEDCVPELFWLEIVSCRIRLFKVQFKLCAVSISLVKSRFEVERYADLM